MPAVLKTSHWAFPHSETAARAALIGFLAISAVYIVLRYALLLPDGGQIWTTGDWLIHYGAGFVRRGLTGTLTIWISDATGLDLILTAALMQVAVYVVFVAAVLWMLAALPLTVPLAMLALSPVFLLMPFYVLKLAMIKEMVGFLALALMAMTAFTGRSRWLWSGVAVFAVAGFAHEINAFLAPAALAFVLLYVAAGTVSRRTALSVAAAIVLAAGAAIGASMAFPGFGLSGEICRQIVERGASPMFCDPDWGPIGWLERDMAYGIAFTWGEQVISGVWPWFVVAYLLAMLPFGFFRLTGAPERSWLVHAAAFLGILFLAPLFIVASDWGRWIAMHVTALTLLTFAALRLGLIEERRPALHPLWLLLPLVWSTYDYGQPLSAGFADKVIRLVEQTATALTG